MIKAPEAPSIAESVLIVARLQATRLRRGRKLRLAVAATFLVVLGAVIARYAAASPDAERTVRTTLDAGFFGFLVYLLPFLLNAGAISEEVEGRTFTYLAGRPIHRASLTMGKWLAGVAFATLTLAIGVIALHLGAFATSPTLLAEATPASLRAIFGLFLLGTYYGAICFFWGALFPEASGIVSIVHLVTVEYAFGKMPGLFRLISMNHHAEQLAGLPKGGFLASTVPDLAPWASVAALLVATALFLGLSAVVVLVQEYRFSKA